MNKLLRTAIVGTALLTVPYIALADETATATSNGVSVTGTYEGTASVDATTKDLTYTQGLDLVVVGTSSDGSVTVNIDETATVGDLYLDTNLFNFDVRLGKVDSITGIEVGTSIAGFTVSVHKATGSGGATTVDASTVFGPINLSGEDVFDDDRLLSAGMEIAGIDVGGSYQNTTTGTNTILDAGLGIQGISVDVAHASIGDASVTKTGTSKHALLGTMTSATNGTSVKGVKASLGDLSAKLVSLNSNNTYTLALERGIMTYSYEKVSGGASTVSAGVKVTF
jgi:hypothetical protein